MYNKINNMTTIEIPSGTATMIDIARSYNYAAAQVERIKCQDKNILEFACTGDNKKCLKWKVDPTKLSWVPVNGIDATSSCTKDSDCNEVYPFCINNTCSIQSDPYNTNIKMAMGPGQCQVVDKDVCNAASTYPYEKYDVNTQTYVSTTRPYIDGDYGGMPDFWGRCKPQNCNPKEDKNCSPKTCTPASCRDDNDCGQGNGTTGKCNTATRYCEIDSNHKCSTDDDCGDGTGGCSNSGQYILTDDQKKCWGENGEKDPDTGKSKYPAKECDPVVTTGFCYETGSCPEPYVEKNNSIVYLEWHGDAGTCDLDGKTKLCEYGKNSSCISVGEGEVGRCSCIHDDDCAGNSTCEDVDGETMKLCSIYDVNGNRNGRCVYGNHLLRQYSENPQCRGGAESNSDTAAFNHFNTLPPFAYDKGIGTPYLTDNYCWYGNMKWGKRKEGGDKDDTKVLTKHATCTDSVGILDTKTYPNGSVDDPNNPCTDKGEGWYCAKEYSDFRTPTGQWKCTGPGSQCKLPSGWQEFWQLTLGKTLYNGFFGTGWGKCHLPNSFEDAVTPKEMFKKQKVNSDPLKQDPDIQKIRSIVSGFTKIKDVVMILIDPDFIMDSKVLLKNYSMGLDLIAVQYKDGKNGITLDYSQVNEKLPHLIVKKKGKKYIKLEKDKCIKDKGLRKLYATLGSKLI